MSKPVASLSLDLDNKWSYLKTHGDAGWDRFPSYLDVVVPRFLEFFRDRGLTITVFVVGQDAALEKNRDALASIAAAGHEIGNHSFHHEPWLHLYTGAQLETEIARAEEHLERVTGQRPIGFRGPGFSFSDVTLRTLARRGYEYDASLFPTFLGPLARAYYFRTAKLDDQQQQQRSVLFGTFREGFKTNRPHWCRWEDGQMLRIPVTTLPLLKIPIHVSYLLYLAQFSEALALAYWRSALRMCQMARIAPSLLLHPLDFMGCDDDADLVFFPAMRLPAARKLKMVGEVIRQFTNRFEVTTMQGHARSFSRALQEPALHWCDAPSGDGK